MSMLLPQLSHNQDARVFQQADEVPIIAEYIVLSIYLLVALILLQLEDIQVAQRTVGLSKTITLLLGNFLIDMHLRGEAGATKRRGLYLVS